MKIRLFQSYDRLLNQKSSLFNNNQLGSAVLVIALQIWMKLFEDLLGIWILSTQSTKVCTKVCTLHYLYGFILVFMWQDAAGVSVVHLQILLWLCGQQVATWLSSSGLGIYQVVSCKWDMFGTSVSHTQTEHVLMKAYGSSGSFIISQP